MTRRGPPPARCWAVTLAGLAVTGCELDSSSDGGPELVSREMLADGSVRTIYAEDIVTDAGERAVRQTTITRPVVGDVTTNVVVAVVSGAMTGGTNAVPAGGETNLHSPMPALPGLPPGAVPLPPPP